MFALYTGRLREDIGTIKAALKASDISKALVYAPDGSRIPATGAAAELVELRGIAPELLPWRIYDHCAAFTRLYAAYERFVFDLVGAWLKVLPETYQSYAALPETVRKGYRLGTSEILAKLGGDRYRHLSEESLLRGLFESVTAIVPYRLLPDAFLIDDQNLWEEVLSKLFARIGIPDAWGWVRNHPAVQTFCEDIRGNSSTPESELRNFVLRRNEAAHGTVNEVLSVEEIGKIGDFVVVLCEGLGDLCMLRVVQRRIELGTARKIGSIIREFSHNVIGAEMSACTVAVGDEFVIVRPSECYKVTVQSIQVNHADFPRLDTTESQQVGFGITRTAKVGADIVRLI
jgi:hypothetical protein